METTTTDSPKRSSNRIALGIAIAALLFSLLPYLFWFQDERSFLPFVDLDTGQPVGFVKAEYGILTIGRFQRTPGSLHDLSRLELQLKDDGLTVELHNEGLLPAKWSLTRD